MRKKCGGRDPIDSPCRIYYNVSMHDHLFQLDLDGQVTCSNCGCMDDERDNSDVSPIPTPESLFETQRDFE